MNKNMKMTYWLVKLGKLYYAGGLGRITNQKSTFSFEFTNDEEVASMLGREDIAEEIALECGGVIIKKETTLEKFEELSDKNRRYKDSSEEWDKEQIKQMINGLIK